ncbi:hypothetical protein HKD37_08G022628 [Glycine soja]
MKLESILRSIDVQQVASKPINCVVMSVLELCEFMDWILFEAMPYFLVCPVVPIKQRLWILVMDFVEFCGFTTLAVMVSFHAFSAFAVECEINPNLKSVIMSSKYIISAILGSFGVAWVCDYYVSEKKLFGGSTPGTITNNEWAEETDKKLQAWPRTAGPPVVMNPISRQNFIVKSRPE